MAGSLWCLRKWWSSRRMRRRRQVVLVESILLSITMAGSHGCCRNGMRWCGWSKTLSSATTGNQWTGVSSRCIDSSSAGRYTSVFSCVLTKRRLRSLPPVLFVIPTTFVYFWKKSIIVHFCKCVF
jgi:hypothetical protein